MTQSTILIPLAGEGKRFTDQGYQTPKPLISVAGLPMIIQAARSLPKANKYVFVCRKEHLESSNLLQTLTDEFPESEILPIDYLTEGQASTCLLAELLVDQNHTLTIGACDNGMIYSKEQFNLAWDQSDLDAVIWTFRNNPTVLDRAHMYGWIETEGSKALKVSCKKGISSTPLNDHAIIGSFTFRKAKDFFGCAHELIKQDRRINGEFYVDEVMNIAIESGLKVGVFEVDQYICWGTPDDLRTYEYWEGFFDTCDWHPYTKSADILRSGR